MKIKIGFTQDWIGSATRQIRIIDETISGYYVCQDMPVEMTRPDGSRYLAQPLTGLFLVSKERVTDIQEEKIKEE